MSDQQNVNGEHRVRLKLRVNRDSDTIPEPNFTTQRGRVRINLRANPRNNRAPQEESNVEDPPEVSKPTNDLEDWQEITGDMEDINLEDPDMEEIDTTEQDLVASPTFKPFVRLPNELKLMVWERALPTSPRIIQMRILRTPRIKRKFKNHEPLPLPASAPEPRDRVQHYITTDMPVDPLLSTCEMSREVMLGKYGMRMDSARGRAFYVNDKVDWVMLSDVVLKNNMFENARKYILFQNALRGLRRLVFCAHFLLVGIYRNRVALGAAGLFTYFSSLETLVLYTKCATIASEQYNSEIFGNENLCLLTDDEYCAKMAAVGFDSAQWEWEHDMISDLEDILLGEDENYYPEIEHMWLCPRLEMVKQAEVKEQGERRRIWRL